MVILRMFDHFQDSLNPLKTEAHKSMDWFLYYNGLRLERVSIIRKRN